MESKEQNKKDKQVSIHHLYYAIAIACLIILFGILIFPHGVSRYAFDNVSFASTITSIVLAVVSIVYSIISGNASTGQLENVKDINSEIKKQLDGFSHIEENISKLVNDKVGQVQSEVKTVSEGQKEMSERINEMGKNLMFPSVPDELKSADFSHNSAYGDVFLYACLLAFKKKKIFPSEIFTSSINDYNYWYGYFIALTVCYPQKLQISQVKGKDLFVMKITSFDESFFGNIQKIKERIDRRVNAGSPNDSLQTYLNKINSYFNNIEDVDNFKNEEIQ